MTDLIKEMDWLAELDILTRFHPSNIACNLEEDEKETDEDIEKDAAEKASEEELFRQSPRTRGLGRGCFRVSNQEDDNFISRKIEEVLGRGHRGSVFHSSNTFIDNKEMVKNSNRNILHSKQSSTVKEPGKMIPTVRPQLVKNMERMVMKRS